MTNIPPKGSIPPSVRGNVNFRRISSPQTKYNFVIPDYKTVGLGRQRYGRRYGILHSGQQRIELRGIYQERLDFLENEIAQWGEEGLNVDKLISEVNSLREKLEYYR